MIEKEKVIISCPEVNKMLNGKSDFNKVFKKYYNGIIRDMKAGVFTNPIAGTNKNKNVIDEKLAMKWAINKTLSINSESLKRIASRI